VPSEKGIKKAMVESAPWPVNNKATDSPLPVYPWLNYPIYIIFVVGPDGQTNGK